MIYLICGKICSGKTVYANKLKAKHTAVILSTDEATYDLIDNAQGEFYNGFARRVNRYLMKKAAEIAAAGADVILDWGFWTQADRQEVSQYFRSRILSFQWHYIDIPDSLWRKNIASRNARILAGKGGSDFYVDDGLLKKLLSLFQIPEKDEIDVWVIPDEKAGPAE